MASKTERVTIDHGDLSAPYGSPAWVRGVHFEAIGALNDATSSREHLERWVRALRESEAYHLMSDERGRPFLLWEAYCTARQPFGLGYASDEIDAILTERRSAAAIDAVDRAEKAASHQGQRTDLLYDVQEVEAPTGNSTKALLRRLRKDRPDLHARVLKRELSPWAASIEAGWRKRTVDVEPTVAGAVKLLGKLDPDQRAEVARSMGWTS